jgi:UTP--glucose-1-phosphate uridylyltransferase
VKFTKAIIPMGSARHRDLPLQHITTGDGRTKRVVALHIEELLAAGIEQVALVTSPGSAPLFSEVEAQFGSQVILIEQAEPRGFGHAILCTERWVADEPFLLQVCDHVFITYASTSCTRQLIETAERESCAVSAVQVTPESQLPYFGVIGGHRVKGDDQLYAVDAVLEKPTPTVAEEQCVISGLRQGSYLGFFGTHALTPSIFGQLREIESELPPNAVYGLTEALARLLECEKYLALEVRGHRIDLEGPFGLLRAQVALALHGSRREAVLQLMLEEVAQAQALSP